MQWKYLDNMQQFTGNAEIMILKRGEGGIYFPPLPPFDDDRNGITCYCLLLLPARPTPRRSDFPLVLSAIKWKRTLFKNPRHTSHANTATVSVTSAFETRANQKKS
jgi:hypothetical protein